MAERRYSESDRRKIVQDRLANLRARGIDARQIHSLHPGGVEESLREIERDIPWARDQSQEQRKV